MKKILFALVALMCSMSMNAQVMKVMKGNEVVATYTADQADNVVFEEEQGSTTTGTAKRTDDIDVNWVQLWEDGPKFAEYNVGAANNKAEDYGGYYAWSGADIATNLWGSAWRMPTKEELDALLAKCDVAWTDNYNETGVKGGVFTGKGDYDSNSVFLPAAGLSFSGNVYGKGDGGHYWSSTPGSSGLAYSLSFTSGGRQVYHDNRNSGFPVRAVLAE